MKKLFLILIAILLFFIIGSVNAVKNVSYVNIDSNIYYADPVVRTTSGVVSFGDYIYVAYIKDINSIGVHTYNNEIWLASSFNNGVTFSTRKIITATVSAYGIERLDMKVDKDGYLHLTFFNNALGEYYSYSVNNGVTWSSSELITASTGSYGIATIDINNFQSDYTKRARVFVESGYYSRQSGSWALNGSDGGISRGFVKSDGNVWAIGSANPYFRLYGSVDDGINWSEGRGLTAFEIVEHGGISQSTDKNIITMMMTKDGTTYYYEIRIFETDKNSIVSVSGIARGTNKGDYAIFDNNSLQEYVVLFQGMGTDINNVLDYRASYGANFSSFDSYNLGKTINQVKLVFNPNNMGVIANIGSDQNLVYFKIPTPNANLTNNLTESSDPTYNDVNFWVRNDLRNADTNAIVSSTDCNITFSGTIYDMPYDSSLQKYVFDHREAFPSTYPYTVDCTDANFNSSSTDGNITVTVNYAPYITITDIENVTHSTVNQISFYPTTEANQIIFSAESSYPASLGVTYNIENSLKDFRQYFVYVANPFQYDNNQWVFSDLLTYGSSANYDDPIQKIWDNSKQKYVYSFTDTLGSSEKKYYKIVYRYPMRYWNNLNNDEWWHQFVPQTIDINGISWDKYSVSTYSNIFSRFKIYVPDVNSTQPYAYELQFNAYASSSIPLTVGVYNDSNYGFVSSKTVTLSTTEKRYSVDVQANDVNQLIYFKTNSSTANNVYFSNVVLIQRAYFKTRLELQQENFEELPVWISDINGFSYSYIDEGIPFRFKTQAYDRDAHIRTERVEVYAYGINDTNKVLSTDLNISNYTPETTIDLSGLIQGIILVTEGANYLTRTPILVKITLIDEYGYAFAETGKWIKLHEFPFFNTDFFLQTREDTRTLNSAPKGKIFLQSRIPSNIEDVEMFIYYGNYMCPKWRSGSSACNTANQASDKNLAFRFKFYKNDSCDNWTSNEAGCFTCNNANDCSFEYNLENKFHYAGIGFHTTFTLMHFNTTDTNIHYSKTLYEIGQQTVKILTEVQGLDQDAYEQCDGNYTVAGSRLFSLSSKSDMYDELISNQVVINLLSSGKTSYLDVQRFVDNYYDNCFFAGGLLSLPCITLGDNLLSQFLGRVGCGAKITQSMNLKIVAKLYTALLDDIHSYESIYLQITPCNDDNVTCQDVNRFSNKIYPVMSYYDISLGSNVFVWNSILYDENANYLTNGKFYRIDFFGTDQTYRNKDVNTRASNDGNFLIEIDNSFSVSAPQYIQWLPLNLSATSKDQLYLSSFLNTNNKFLDKMEFVLYTDYSSYDLTKSDKENQIIRFSIDSGELQKSKNYYDFNALIVYKNFVYEHANADLVSACIVGGGTSGALVFAGVIVAAVGAGTLTLGTGAIPAAAIAYGLLGGMVGCGSASLISSAVGDIKNTQLDQNFNAIYNDWNASEYKVVDFTFTDLHVNDYQELLKANDLTDKNTTPETIINDLTKKGKTVYSKNLKVNVMGKNYEFENVLVGEGTLYDMVKLNKLKIRINTYYDYFTKNSVHDLEIGSLEAPPSNFWDSLNIDFIKIFNKYAIMILGLVLIVVVVVFISRGTTAKRDER